MAFNQTVLRDIKKSFEDVHLVVKIYWIPPASQWNSTTVITLLCVPLSLLLLVLLPFLWLGWRTFASFLLLFAVERTNGAPVGNCTVQQSFQACPRCHWIPSRMSIGNTEWSKKEWRLNKTIYLGLSNKIIGAWHNVKVPSCYFPLSLST